MTIEKVHVWVFTLVANINVCKFCRVRRWRVTVAEEKKFSVRAKYAEIVGMHYGPWNEKEPPCS